MPSAPANPTKLFELAITHHQSGNLPEAERCYRAILQASPREFDALHFLGVLQAQRGRPQEGVKLIQQALSIKPQSAEANSNLANILLELGHAEEAASFARKAVAIQPQNIQAIYILGNALRDLRNFDDALLHYDTVLAMNPQFFPALNSRGRLLNELDRHHEALASFERALAIMPDEPGILVNIGNLQRALDRDDEALASYRRALAIKPDFAGAHNELGNALQGQGKLDEAVASFRTAILLQPDFVVAHNNLGSALHEQHNLDEAIASFQKALAITPDFADAHNNLGFALHERGALDHAIDSYRKALSFEPDFVEAHNNLGNALRERGKLDESVASYHRALSFNPHFAASHCNLGLALKMLGKLDAAIAQFHEAVAIKPDYADAHNYLALALWEQGKLDDAAARARIAISINPDYADAHNNLALALQDQGKLDDAIASYHKALALKPNLDFAYSNLLFCLNYHPDLSAEDIYAEYRRWNDAHTSPFASKAAHANSRDTQRRLRVGYVSPDFRHHSARHFIEPLLENHDKARVEVFAYAEVAKEDGVSARIRAYVDHWQCTVGLSDDEMADMIRADGIDILVDLAGHTKGNRLPVFARKPAPIQVSWMGFGYTTGLDAMDYFLADRHFAPPGCEPLFSEKIVHLPVYAAYRPADGMGDAGPLPALQNGRVTFGTISRSIRINYRVIRAWASILNRVPNARLLIDSFHFQSDEMQTRIRDQFAAHGVAPERLEIGFSSPAWNTLRKIDIGLDCFPHNSGTTLFESLYMSVPYVTLAERPSVGRLGSSILAALGHPEWIARTEAEYIDKAVALATDIDRLASLRAGLRDQMKQSALMNEAAFARSVESAYQTMLQQWCQEHVL